MHSLLAALLQDKTIKRIRDCFSEKSQTLVYGLGAAHKHAVFSACYEDSPAAMAVIVHDRESAEGWKEDIASLLPDAKILELAELDSMEVEASARSLERIANRMEIMGRFLKGEKLIVIAEAAAAVQKSISAEDFRRLSFSVSAGDKLPRDDLLKKLLDMGYERTAEVEYVGQFSVRGGILDVFPVNSGMPVRIEFFDEEVDSVRSFDIESKLSVTSMESFALLPMKRIGAGGDSGMFLSGFPEDGVVLLDEPMRIREQIRALSKEDPERNKTSLFVPLV